MDGPSSYNNTDDFDFDYDYDYIKNLVKKEYNLNESSLINYPSWIIDSRFEAIRWIINAQSVFKYNNQTVYLSVSYLDLFLSIRCFDEDKLWAIRLLSIACLSIAAKMEECKVASLSEYPVSEFGFDCRAIQKMELLVLSTFQWKMSVVTPFAYLRFFTKTVCDQTIEPIGLISKAVELVMALIQEIKLIEYRPSVIALAAVLAAADWQMTKETLKLKLNPLSLWETSDNQPQEKQLLSCYSLMQRLSTKGNNSTPGLTDADHTSDETPCLVGTKRRLDFPDKDPNPSSSHKITRHHELHSLSISHLDLFQI